MEDIPLNPNPFEDLESEVYPELELPVVDTQNVIPQNDMGETNLISDENNNNMEPNLPFEPTLNNLNGSLTAPAEDDWNEIQQILKEAQSNFSGSLTAPVVNDWNQSEQQQVEENGWNLNSEAVPDPNSETALDPSIQALLDVPQGSAWTLDEDQPPRKRRRTE
jgi:hypothetical protein